MYGTQRATQYGYSLWEFQVYGTGTTGGHAPHADRDRPTRRRQAAVLQQARRRPRPPRATRNCWRVHPRQGLRPRPGHPLGDQLDHGWVDPRWIHVDLGATAQIHKVVLQWDPAYARAYQIQVSADGTNWTTIYSTTTGTGFKQTLTVTGTGRYVRMYGTRAPRLRLLAVGVPGLRHRRRPHHAARRAAGPGSPAAARVERRVQRRRGHQARPGEVDARHRTGPNNELEYYTNNNNATMDGAGNLVMEARKEVTAGSAARHPLRQHHLPVHLGAGSTPRTSSASPTAASRRGSRCPGSRACGRRSGCWAPTSSTGRPGRTCGEIDIMENVGKDPNTVYSTHPRARLLRRRRVRRAVHASPADFADDFHVFAVDWNSKRHRRSPSTATVFSPRTRRRWRPPADRGSSTTRSS